MPPHMRVSLKAEARRLPRPFHHSSKPRCDEWCPALAGEHKWRLRVLLTLQRSERPQFIPRIGWVLGDPRLTLRTARVAAAKSI
jgi:hypothetical protein